MCFIILIVNFSSGAFQYRLMLSGCPFREVLCVLLSGARVLSPGQTGSGLISLDHFLF